MGGGEVAAICPLPPNAAVSPAPTLEALVRPRRRRHAADRSRYGRARDEAADFTTLVEGNLTGFGHARLEPAAGALHA
jgi:hypothetical protein